MSQWAQLVASASGVVLGGVAEVVGSNLARGKIFTACIHPVDSLYPSVYIYIYAFIAIYIDIYFEWVLQKTKIDSWRSEETQMVQVPSIVAFC